MTFSGGAMTMQQNRTLEARWVANAAAYGIEDQGPDPNSGSTDMGNVSWVCPTIHPELAICEEGVAGPLDPVPRRRRDARGRRDDAAGGDAGRPVGYELFADPALVAGGVARVPRPRPEPGGRPTARPPVLAFGPARPAGRPMRTGGARARRRPRCRPAHRPGRADRRGGPRGRAPGRRPPGRRAPRRRRRARRRPRRHAIAGPGFAAANGWDREYETYSDFDLPTYVGPTTFMNLPWVTDPAELHAQGRRRRDRRRAVRRRGQPPAGRALRAARDPRGPVHLGLDQLPPARRRAVRDPARSSTPATRTSCRPGSSGATR